LTKIRVKVGSAEAEVEADPEHLREAIDLVPELAQKLPGFKPDGRQGPEPGKETGSTAGPPPTVPSVTVEKGDSLSDIIAKFFSDSWGTERRKLSDVRYALESYGLNYPKQSVAVALLRLAKTTKIRRFRGDDGEFVYTSSSLMPRTQTIDMVTEQGESVASQPN